MLFLFLISLNSVRVFKIKQLSFKSDEPECNPLISTFYISTFLCIDLFSKNANESISYLSLNFTIIISIHWHFRHKNFFPADVDISGLHCKTIQRLVSVYRISFYTEDSLKQVDWIPSLFCGLPFPLTLSKNPRGATGRNDLLYVGRGYRLCPGWA